MAAETTVATETTTEGTTASGEAVTIEGAGTISSVVPAQVHKHPGLPPGERGCDGGRRGLGSDPGGVRRAGRLGDHQAIEFMTRRGDPGRRCDHGVEQRRGRTGTIGAVTADAGIPVVSWDSPIPSAEGESVFIAQVDFDETGQVMADMALEILGEDGGQFAILSATPRPPTRTPGSAMEEVLTGPEYANLELVDTVYGNDVAEDSVHPGIGAGGLASRLGVDHGADDGRHRRRRPGDDREGLCDQVKVSGWVSPRRWLSTP